MSKLNYSFMKFWGVRFGIMVFSILISLASYAQTTVAAWNGSNASSYPPFTPTSSHSTNTGARLNTNTSGAINTSVGDAQGQFYLSNGWDNGANSKAWTVSLVTTGFTNIKVSSKQRSTALGFMGWNGPGEFKLQYSLNNSTWVDVGTNINPRDNWSSGNISNVSLPVACENQPALYLRWVMRSNTPTQSSPGSFGSPAQSYIDDISITGTYAVTNTAPSIANQTFSINENSTNGTTVGTVVASDAESNPLTYSITAGNSSGAFAINSSNGKITVANTAQLDYEITTSYALTVSVSDGSLSSSATVTVNVNNVNEVPTIAAQSFSIDENKPNGTLVGTVIAADVDGNSLNYSITAGNTSGAFTIGSTTGQITVANSMALDYETTPTFSLTVRAFDGSLAATATITISLNDVAEVVINTAPVINNAAISVNEDGNINLLSAIEAGNPNTFTDAENDDPQAMKFVSMPVHGTIYQDGGYPALVNTEYSLAQFSLMYYTPNAHYFGSDGFELNISDGDLYADAPATVTISVASVNDAPVLENLVIAMSEDQSVKITDFATATTYTDEENDPIEALKIVQLPTRGVLTLFGTTIAAGDVIPAYQMEQVTYRPGLHFNGTDSFVFSASDGMDYAAANATAIITIAAVNDAPIDISVSATTVDENLPAGSLVGNLSTFDFDANDSHIYQFVAGTGDRGNGYFTIDGDKLLVANMINYEQTMQLPIRLQATDAGGLSVEKTFTLNVNDKNDAPTGLVLSNNTVAEQQPAGSFVGIMITADEDGGDVHTLTLVNGAGSADNANFSIVNNVLTTQAVLDFNTQQQHFIRVRSTDAAGAFTEQAFVINVQDINQAPTSIALSNTSLLENNVLGALVGHFNATDVDAGDSHTYTLVNGAGDADNASFQIVNADLEAAMRFDFEIKSAYSIRVRATDLAGASTEAVFIITIADGADAPTAIALSNSAINENMPLGTFVGNLSTMDSDQANGHVYAFATGAGATDNGAFTLQNGALYSAIPFNFEAKNSYSIRLRATDNTQEYVEQVFTISINDVSDAPTAITTTVLGIDENATVGTAVGFFGTIDEDILDTHTYTLAPGYGAADNGKFTILANKLQVNAPVDFETQNSYAVRVRATDRAGAFVEQYFTVAVNDINEAPTGLTLSANTIAENLPAGTVVGTFTIADQDANDNHQFELAAGAGDSDNTAFYISGNKLMANASFNFEVKNTYSIRVAATDLGGLKEEKNFTITISNVVEAPIVSNLTKQVFKNTNTPFNSREFGSAYSHEEGRTQKHIKITSLPAHGQLLFSNTPVALGQTILVTEFVALSYSPMLGYLGTDGFTFAAYDGILYSADATYTLNVVANRIVGGATGTVASGTIMNPSGAVLNTNRTADELTGVEAMPLEINGFGNFPNPFQETTTIAFELPTSMAVTVEVYDIMGRKVDTLLSETMLEGKQTLVWNSEAVGQYICRISASGANGETIVKTIKLLQVK